MKLLYFSFLLVFFLFETTIPAKQINRTRTTSLKSSNLNKIDNKLAVRRRITNLEKEILQSNNPRKVRVGNRTVIMRNVFLCNQSNVAMMLKGNAPLGYDGKKVNLHHMKQQKNGDLVELTQTEHNQHSKVLHRYNRKNSDISDRNGDFQKFRNSYWKKQASSCIARGR